MLNRRVVTVASLLRDHGYHTYMAGKWHLGMKPDQIPHARGFERDFSLLVGGASHFNDSWNLEWQIPKAPYTEDGKPLEKLPKGFYSTKHYTDKTIQFIEEGRNDGKPFFAYMAFTAPMARSICRMTGCAAIRTATTRVGMGSANSAWRACRNWASWTKASMPLTAFIFCRGPRHSRLRCV